MLKGHQLELKAIRTYFVNMVVNVLASNSRCDGVAFTDAAFGAGVLELQTLLLETGLDGGIVAVVLLALFNGSHLVDVLLWEDFTVLDGLHRGVVVVLVNLTVDGGSSLLMTVLGNIFVDYGRGDLLMNGGVIVTGLAPVIAMSVYTVEPVIYEKYSDRVLGTK